MDQFAFRYHKKKRVFFFNSSFVIETVPALTYLSCLTCFPRDHIDCSSKFFCVFFFFLIQRYMIQSSEKVALVQRDLFIVQEPNFLDYVLQYFLPLFCQFNVTNLLCNTEERNCHFPPERGGSECTVSSDNISQYVRSKSKIKTLFLKAALSSSAQNPERLRV